MPSSALPPLALYTLSLHDALPICAPANTVAPARQSGALSRVREDPLEEFVTVRPVRGASLGVAGALAAGLVIAPVGIATAAGSDGRSEEHTSELQSLRHLVCRLLLCRLSLSTLFPYTTLFRSALRPIRWHLRDSRGHCRVFEKTPWRSS